MHNLPFTNEKLHKTEKREKILSGEPQQKTASGKNEGSPLRRPLVMRQARPSIQFSESRLSSSMNYRKTIKIITLNDNVSGAPSLNGHYLNLTT
jgi:hypothetical protein